MLRFPALRVRGPAWRCLANAASRTPSPLQSSLGSLEQTAVFPAIFQVCGADTDVGKTVVSAGLARASARHAVDVLYVKPIQSGYPKDNDSALVFEAASRLASAKQGASHLSAGPTSGGRVTAVTCVKLSAPASPDLAASLEDADMQACSDSRVCELLVTELEQFGASARDGWMGLVEGAGGVLSPAPSGTLQADLLRPLRLPTVLVGDSSLGGISSTICAFEALHGRGYDVPAVLFFGQESYLLDNATSVQKYLASTDTDVFCAPELPSQETPLAAYIGSADAGEFFENLRAHLMAWSSARYNRLRAMPDAARRVFWYPFTQHASLDAAHNSDNDSSSSSTPAITTIDSAHGSRFSVFHPSQGPHTTVDAIGSWWTTGLGHGDPSLARAVAHAAGRYGHVMFPEAVHAPALSVAQMLIDTVGRGWASRAFFSDNGSTAVEVALKMAFRTRAAATASLAHDARVVALHGGYHGDTLGAMDCAPRSDYNAAQTPWYSARGIFFTPPTVSLSYGVWRVARGEARDEEFPSRMAVFDSARDGREYDGELRARLDAEGGAGGERLGALLLEPVMQAAGGMRIVDPAFQRALVRVCRERGVPVVFDEVFTGVWRLGRGCAAELLGVQPDVAAYAKLLTGGVVPLAVTLARKEVFEAFLGEGKREALLHGHSYTAHAVGCAAAVEALQRYACAPLYQAGTGMFGDFWDEGLAREISCWAGVRGVTCLGTVLSVELEAVDGVQGYAAAGGVRVAEALKRHGVFSRPLGNVVYVMCAPMATREECALVEKVFVRVLMEELGKDTQHQVRAE